MRLKVITSNPGKVREYERELSQFGIEMEHLRHPYDEVQTSDLEEVVNKGMDAIISEGIRDFIVDDSGLFVDALKGFPGVWSAYAQKTIGNPGILKLMDGVEDRGAEFRCCIGCDIAGKRIVPSAERTDSASIPYSRPTASAPSRRSPWTRRTPFRTGATPSGC